MESAQMNNASVDAVSEGELNAVFKPRIVAYCCQYCAYAAADLAGNLRLQYAPSIKVVFVPCSGRVSELNILQAFEDGVDGVIVAGCRIGDCHFNTGNLQARRRVRYAKKLLDQIGLQDERIEMYHLSSAEAERFVLIANEMTACIHQLGPSPLRRDGSKHEKD